MKDVAWTAASAMARAATAPMTTEPRLVAPVGAALGEGPAWCHSEGMLRFVDIKGGKVHRWCPQAGLAEPLHHDGQPSFVLMSSDDRLVIGSGCQVIVTGYDGRDRQTLCDIPMPAHNRTNDATVDDRGRLWFGTMDDAEHRSTGSIYCLDRGQLLHIGGDAVVTNGPAISGDGGTLYHVDSGERTIWRHGIEEGPRLGPGEIFLQLTAADGHPDGIVIDSEDCLWVALWDGWAVRRYAPDGMLLAEIRFPCARITKIAFGGADLKTAFVTSARVGLSDAELAAQPLAGALFAFDAPAPGRILPRVRLA